MNLRQFLEHEWQSIARVADRLREATGINLPEVALRRVLLAFPDVQIDEHAGRVRLRSEP